MNGFCLLHSGFHLGTIKSTMTVYTVLVRKTAMSLYDLVPGNVRLTLQCVDVLREACVKQLFVR